MKRPLIIRQMLGQEPEPMWMSLLGAFATLLAFPYLALLLGTILITTK